MTYFMQNGDAFLPTAGKDALLDCLPPGNYVVAKSMAGMFFQRAEKFPAPGKLYGDIERQAERIMTTFLDRERATGALFAGEKGSGKTQLARLISHKGYALGLPTILVNNAWAGDEFSGLLASIEQPAIVIFDEFEKVYNRPAQEAVLTLLDGTMTTKKLFLLTVNDTWAVNDHMKNRPGRLFYSLEFNGLDASFVRDYCLDNLDNQGHVEAMVKVSSIFTAFNFDMLKALVEEMNRYKEDPFEAMKMLNTKPVTLTPTARYELRVWTLDGQEVTPEPRHSVFTETPLHSDEGEMYYYFRGEAGAHDIRNDVVTAGQVKRVDASQGIFEFETDSHKVVYTKRVAPAQDMRSLAF